MNKLIIHIYSIKVLYTYAHKIEQIHYCDTRKLVSGIEFVYRHRCQCHVQVQCTYMYTVYCLRSGVRMLQFNSLKYQEKNLKFTKNIIVNVKHIVFTPIRQRKAYEYLFMPLVTTHICRFPDSWVILKKKMKMSQF